MWPRLSIVLGLVAGVAAGALILGALLFLTPDPGSGDTPSASPSTPPSAVPSPTPASPTPASTAPAPSVTPAPSITASPSASPSGSSSPSASAAAELFHIGEPTTAPVSVEVTP
jgi:cytoskeletal protein RodZ